jgi:hypothetical protein
MKRNHVAEPDQTMDSPRPASTPPQRMSLAEPAAERWQALQGAIGNAAVGRLLGGTPAAPSAIAATTNAPVIQRQVDDEAMGQSEAAPDESAGVEAGLGGGSEAEEMSSGKKRTKEEAIALVDKHVEPKECFVWYENSKVGWAPMPGTGCAHWVAHQLGYSEGLKCDKGFTVRVRNIVSGRKKVEMKDVQVGDLWENAGDASHIGIIRSVNKEEDKVTSVEVEHDSVRSGGVVKSTFTEGLFYR